MAQAIRGIERDIRGGKAQEPPALVAVAHDAAHEVGMAEQLARSRDVAIRQRLARRRGGDGLEASFLVLRDPVDDLDRDAKAFAFRAKKRRVALAPGAECGNHSRRPRRTAPAA